MATKINKEYNFNCGLCNKPTDIETIDKGSSFSGHKLICKTCENVGYMVIFFVPEEEDLNTLIEQYKSAIAESKADNCGGCDDDTGKCGHC